MICNEIKPVVGQGTIELIDYSPITVNSSVDSSVNSSTGSTANDSKAYATGSSTSETNSYDVSVNLSKAGGINAGYAHSSTVTADQSATTGTETGADRQFASSESMSIKEWGSYLSIDPQTQAAMWTWTQEYPWNCSIFGQRTSSATSVPPFVFTRLFVGTDASGAYKTMPPSTLSLVGITFVSKARWAYFPTAGDDLQFRHSVTYQTGTHTIASSTKSATIDQMSTTIAPIGTVMLSNVPIIYTASTNIVSEPPSLATNPPSTTTTLASLSQLALDPLGGSDHRGAVVGLTATQFRTPLPHPTDAFIVAPASNDLFITGTGFSFSSDLASMFQADVRKGPITFTVSFKVSSTDDDYTLYIRHWKSTPLGCSITCVINDLATVIRHVDEGEVEGGSDNMMRLVLRNLDYSSTEFFDYLRRNEHGRGHSRLRRCRAHDGLRLRDKISRDRLVERAKCIRIADRRGAQRG
jgi:hypothetical protein